MTGLLIHIGSYKILHGVYLILHEVSVSRWERESQDLQLSVPCLSNLGSEWDFFPQKRKRPLALYSEWWEESPPPSPGREPTRDREQKTHAKQTISEQKSQKWEIMVFLLLKMGRGIRHCRSYSFLAVLGWMRLSLGFVHDVGNSD